jgi:Peptidase A4 family
MKFARTPGLAAAVSCAFIAIGSLAPAQLNRVPAPHQHRPVDIHAKHFDGSYESTNWSGYAVTGSNFTQVTGSWIVPASTCAKGSSAEYAAFWIGIDGWTSNSVEQIGTDSDCSNGTPSYYAWYEFYPEPSYYAGRLTNLKPGDVMTSSVTFNAARNQFTGTITDTTSGATFSTTFSPTRQTGTPARSSVEWIAEAPSGQVGRKIQVLPLADFNVIKFGPDYMTAPNTSTATVGTGSPAPIGSFGASVNSTTMVSDGSTAVPMATPSPLTSDGSSFSVTWNNVGP